MRKIFVQTSATRGVVLDLHKSPTLGKGATNSSVFIALEKGVSYRRVYETQEGRLFVRYQNAICSAFVC